MKKIFYLLTGLLTAGALTSCGDDNNTDKPDIPTEEAGMKSGLYIINNGNMSTNIPGSVTAYDYETGTVTPALQDAFREANGVALGEGAQPAIVYGSKMYIPMQTSNLIWVVNPRTLKVIETIRPTGEATGPRFLAAAEGKVFASMVSGYVSVVDTLNLGIEMSIQTGPNPEQMAVAGGKLYVANSDGYNWEGAGAYSGSSISVIDLKSYAESKLIADTSKVMNPTDMASNGTDVFVLCKGNYADVPCMVKKIVGNDVEDVTLGNYMAVSGNKLYVINSPFGIDRKDMGFTAYNTTSLAKEGEFLKQTEGADSWIANPSSISVDPVSGDIVVTSYYLTEEGYAQYGEPGYANIYDRAGNFRKRIECGIGAVGATFVHPTTNK